MPHVHDGGEGGKAPLVSFLTSAYRTERYINETIESVLAQTRGDWQLIVVDNGNSDEMARIIGNYTSDPRITLIRQDNKGIDGEFSAAANAADGRYLCPLHSDDALVHLSPGLLAAIHPAKNRLASALRRAHYRMLGQLRGEAPSRLERAGARAPLEGEL